MTNKYLKILSASAGSGKTYNLVQEFLKLTLTKPQENLFSSIAAMTFTNKASLEMKERIIEALDVLSYPNRPTVKEKEKRDDFLLKTAENLKIDTATLEKNAKRVLKEILHQFEDFNVLTIDKFSLRLIRTFARDLDQSEDFNVVLDESFLIEQVVDLILSNIGQPEHKELTALALNYAKSNLEEGDKWDFRNNLISFASLLTKEVNQQHIEKVTKLEYTRENYQALKKQLSKIEADYTALKEKTKTQFASFGITDLPQGRNGVLGLIEKIDARDFSKRPKIGENIKKTLSGEILKPKHFFPAEAKQVIENFYREELVLFELYYVTRATRKNFYNLALLKYVANQLQELKKNENIIRISEFNKLISNLISEENTLYIYERLGNRFQHYLLDEFQDTSRLQWLNLIPLIDESIARGKDNLIVGDPKQAIYRFRNGLVEQFMALPSIYEAEKEPLKLGQFNANLTRAGFNDNLKQNWRSNKNIVQFNNVFFPIISEHLTTAKQEAYKDVAQQLKGDDGGYIEIIRCDDKLEKQDKFSLEYYYLYTWIKQCEADGFERGDICILARNKKQGAAWAQFLTKQKEKYKIVSADSLAIKSDKTVQLFIDYLNLRRNFANRNRQTQFAVSYFIQKAIDPLAALNAYWINNEVGKLNLEEFISTFFESEEKLLFPYENLYDLGQQFTALFKVNELENPYLHHLMEMLQNFDQNEGPDIRAFLEFWEQKGRNETVQVPKNKDAIQIMTIHQSKGLEFPVVILPNLDWHLAMIDDQFIENENGDLLYTIPGNEAPDFIINAKHTELDQKLMDELNLLYVAMTRPVQRLYLLSGRGAGTYKSLNDLVVGTLDNLTDPNLKKGIHEELTQYTYGFPEKNKLTRSKTTHTFEPESIKDVLWFPEISLRDKDALETEDLSTEQRFGNQLHLILSETNSLDDLKKVIENQQQKGILEREMIKELEENATKVLSNDAYQLLLKEAHEVLNEQDIIVDQNTIKRPDKLLVNDKNVTILDFKTGDKKEKDIAQLRDYAFALKEIGFENVSGILFYVKLDRLERIF
ncbi:MAG: UvrD-helicase domain-containing protein [Lishizhenia sp.]